MVHEPVCEPPYVRGFDVELPHEKVIQLHWLTEHFGRDFVSTESATVRIIDFGKWNKGAGPDFLAATVEIAGETVRGDIEIDPTPEHWESHGHGANSDFDHVILHVTYTVANKEQVWYPRTSLHTAIPHIILPRDLILSLLSKPVPTSTQVEPAPCAQFLATLPAESVMRVLEVAAAYRLTTKQERWRTLANNVGLDQALYECLAESLGYSQNKHAMRHLARQAPLREVKGNTEAILFGTAGFLVPQLPARCSVEAREYHRQLWEAWWDIRDEFELSAPRSIQWNLSGIRPINHPQRRVAALAGVVRTWREFQPLCKLESAPALTQYLTSLTHPYWSTHSTLPSATLSKPRALIGEQRAQDFIVNHILARSPFATAWQWFKHLPNSGGKSGISSTVIYTHNQFTNLRDDAPSFLRKLWHTHAFLQLHATYCNQFACHTCPFTRDAPTLCQRG